MRIRRLAVKEFGGIREADIELGPGLNVLYGPNDLGKSTLADAIRLALLLPHTSSHVDDYVPWTGGQSPVIELTFETDPQRIWRVRKEFRKGGGSLLEESKNGVDFDEVERARKVDGRLRDILRWGIPEPGGSGGSKGVPSSFLATVLLSTQSEVSAILSRSLQADPSDSGRRRIAAALQAVAQDPLFVALLRDTQARRDAAFTEKGARKTAKGSVFKDAADRVKDARDEKEQWQRVVDDSEGVEHLLREQTARREQREAVLAAARDRTKSVELLSAQAAALAIVQDQVRVARDEVERIRRLGADVAAAEQVVATLAVGVSQSRAALQAAHERLTGAEAASRLAAEAARAAGADSTTAGTVARQSLELRQSAVSHAVRTARQQIDSAAAAQVLVDAAQAADAEQRKRAAVAALAQNTVVEAAASEQASAEGLRRLDLLERALAFRAAEARLASAQQQVEREASLRARLESDRRELERIAGRRAVITVPPSAALAPMRKLANELAGARGALNVGLVVTVTPRRALDIKVHRDGATDAVTLRSEPHEIEADAEVDLELDVATVRIRGGRRDAQRLARSLERRWEREVLPHLKAAGVKDLDALGTTVEEARALDAAAAAKSAGLESLQRELALLTGAADSLREALAAHEAARDGLGDASPASLTPDLTALGADPFAALRKRRQQMSREWEAAREQAGRAGTDRTLAEERTRSAKAALDAAVAARDLAVSGFPDGVKKMLAAARAALASAIEEEQAITSEAAALERTIAAEAARVEAAVSATMAAEARARATVDAAQQAQTTAIAEHASQVGRLEELRRQRDAQDLDRAEERLREVTARLAAVAVPERTVSDAEVADARNAEARARSDLDRTVQEIQRTHGALEQVGGSVARERLRDAIDAFESAERREREVEAEYDAWLLLLEQMRDADAAQASNLGQTLAPAIAGRFEELTRKRYENVRLTAQLETEGVVVSGALRSTDRMSVGTREQLSTLYRLALAEYLKTAVVLDDQLVQSDETRMDWFRAVLNEKSRAFQIVVFTCRPGDYLPAGAMVPKGKSISRDTDAGFTRAIDLGRAIQRR